MHNMRYIKYSFPYVCLILLCIGYSFLCHRPENLQTAKLHVIAYYESGCFQKEMSRVVDRALSLFRRLGHPDSQDVIIFDVDETVLSEYCNFKSIQFGYIPKLSHEWVLAARAPALPEVKRLYDFLVEQGYHIIFLTGRQHDEYKATRKNLILRGFSTFDRLIVRAADQSRLSAVEYKSSARKKLVDEGYHIIGSVGDQWSDMEGGNSGIFIKIPNYAYMIS